MSLLPAAMHFQMVSVTTCLPIVAREFQFPVEWRSIVEEACDSHRIYLSRQQAVSEAGSFGPDPETYGVLSHFVDLDARCPILTVDLPDCT